MQLSDAVMPLVTWYTQNKRPLPWREDPTPYHVWVSEIMLQQTRIEAVIPYYTRFLTLFPTVEVLAAADENLLMKAWEGLGYYSRARNLLKAAQTIVARGSFPRTYETLAALPGVGPYTAGAIASICFGEGVPAVDGNVLRVVLRLLSDRADPQRPDTKARISEMLREVYPVGRAAGAFTQGLMELGERVCIPNGAPDCEHCPLAAICETKKNGLWQEIPQRKKKKERKTEEKTVFLLYCTESGRYAIRKRPDTGLLASTYEFPNCEGHLTGEEARMQADSLGLMPTTVVSLPDSVHIFTHIEWHMKGYYLPTKHECEDFLWVTPDKILSEFAVASAFRAYKKELFPDA